MERGVIALVVGALVGAGCADSGDPWLRVGIADQDAPWLYVDTQRLKVAEDGIVEAWVRIDHPDLVIDSLDYFSYRWLIDCDSGAWVTTRLITVMLDGSVQESDTVTVNAIIGRRQTRRLAKVAPRTSPFGVWEDSAFGELCRLAERP